ncbi:glycoside hydrolase family 76 protein [Aeoliella mucimassa]|uniref:Glycosyl hydrolase family 76 n=1 Tax=Aeoliella mucimassa TaxID=2527972 RepID=A0A518ANN0_9BACT|nr:glycoside hydrolase family 76 protein [Aeoliella mucimassa]QDU56326.1 Glycosyl hydrolase family 76 [Aeoliella mucimassa]
MVSLAEAYQLTGEAVYLYRAIETYDFVLSGEDDRAGGGIYFREGSQESKDTVSTLQAARAGAMLYQITGESDYLEDAERLVEWANTHVQLSSGTYHQGYNIDAMEARGVDIVNATGIGISANLELFHATGSRAYLRDAKVVASASLTRFFDSSTGAMGDEGYWAFELVEALNDLYLTENNPYWLTKVQGAMQWLHDNKQDENGHYELFWGRGGPLTETLTEWHLNEQAAVARALLDTANAALQPGDFNNDGLVDLADYVVWRDNFGAAAGTLPNDTLTSTIGLGQYEVWKQHFGESKLAGGRMTAVPEPSSLVLAFGLMVLVGCAQRRRVTC